MTWNGSLAPGASVTITFAVLLSESWPDPYALVNEAWVADGIGLPRPLRVTVLVNPRQVYFPVARRP